MRTKLRIHWRYRGEIIPRKAPNTVVEQRHTLGQFERAQIAQVVQLAKRQQTINAVQGSIVPMVVAGAALGGVFVISTTWQKVNDLIPSFDGFLDGASQVFFGDTAFKEQVLREAAEEAANDGEPLPLWRKALHRFGVMPKFGGGGVY